MRTPTLELPAPVASPDELYDAVGTITRFAMTAAGEMRWK